MSFLQQLASYFLSLMIARFFELEVGVEHIHGFICTVMYLYDYTFHTKTIFTPEESMRDRGDRNNYDSNNNLILNFIDQLITPVELQNKAVEFTQAFVSGVMSQSPAT